MRRTGAICASGAVLIIAASFLAYAVSSIRTGNTGGVTLHATFSSSGGITEGDSVVLAGLPVGSVESVTLDRSTFLADVTFEVAPTLRIPVDSTLLIAGGSSSGDGTLEIRPGRSSRSFAPGARVTATEVSPDLEQQIGNYIFGNGGLGNSGAGGLD